ncbi:MAG: autotransporter outer membrane beta-barrel domain-containing protein [Methyloligellaceae bacterium]
MPGFTLEGSGKLTVDEGGAIFDNRSDFTPLLSLGSVNIVNNGLIEKAEYIEPLLQTFIGSRTTLDNRGTIRSSGSAFNLDGGFFWLENSGTITSRDHAIFWAQSSGDLDDEKNGINIVNSGLISSTNDVTIHFFPEESLDLPFRIENRATGRITGPDDVIQGNGNLELNNQGFISSGATAIVVPDVQIENSGEIAGTENGMAIAHGTVINSGRIHGTTDSGIDGRTYARNLDDFIGLENLQSGEITGGREAINGQEINIVNAGFISGGENGIAADSGWIFNTGIIETRDESPNRERVSAVEFDHRLAKDAEIINAGIIRSGSGGAGTAIDFRDRWDFVPDLDTDVPVNQGNDHLELRPGNLIIGGINFGLVQDRLTVRKGLNLRYTFDKLPETLDIESVGYQSFDNQDGTVTLLVIDDSVVPHTTTPLFELTSGVSDAVFSHLHNRTRNRSWPQNSGATIWADGFATYREMGARGQQPATAHMVGGLISGIDAAINAQTIAGGYFAAAAVEHRIDGTGMKEVTDSLLFGLYGRFKTAHSSFDMVMTAGYNDGNYDLTLLNNLRDNGYENIRSQSEGWFLAPEIGLTQVLPALGLEVSLRGRYAVQFNDDNEFSDQGLGLTFKGGDTHLVQIRTELARPFPFLGVTGLRSWLTPYVGMENRYVLKGGTREVEFGNEGTGITINEDTEENTAFAGLRFEAEVGTSFSFNAHLEGRSGDNENRTIAGTVGGTWKW